MFTISLCLKASCFKHIPFTCNTTLIMIWQREYIWFIFSLKSTKVSNRGVSSIIHVGCVLEIMNRAHEIMCSSSNVRLITISYANFYPYLLLFFMEEKITFQPIKLKKVFTSSIFLKSQRSGEVVKKKKINTV